MLSFVVLCLQGNVLLAACSLVGCGCSDLGCHIQEVVLEWKSVSCHVLCLCMSCVYIFCLMLFHAVLCLGVTEG